jgi:hypothetical protein
MPTTIKRNEGPQFEGFKTHHHSVLMGSSNAGKTTWLVTQLAEGYIKNYKKFIMFGAANSKDMVATVKKMVAADLITNKKEKLSGEYFNHYLYDDKANYSQGMNNINSRQDTPTIVFFDDVQAYPKYTDEITNFLKKAKNSNVTCFITIHAPTSTKAKEIRDACNYKIFFNAPKNTYATVAKDYFTDNIYSQVEVAAGPPSSHTNDEHRIRAKVAILDQSTGSWYYGFGKHLKINDNSLPNPFNSKDIPQYKEAESDEEKEKEEPKTKKQKFVL